MKNKILAFGVILCMLFSLAAVPASAAESGICGDNLTWTLEGGTLTISGTGGMYSKDVLDDCDYNFKSQIRDIIIKNGVTYISDAFFYCSSLTSVTIPDSVTEIGSGAFSWCSSLTSVTIPDSVTIIGDCAFSNCSSLTSIKIPDSVTSIGGGAFCGCDSLVSITIPDSVEGDILSETFCGCRNLTQVNIGNGVTGIGYEAFGGCSNLKSIEIPGTIVAACAFYGCRSLTTITFINGVTSIGNSAFAGCDSLADIYVRGSAEDWRNASMYSDSQPLLNARIHFVTASGICGDYLTWTLEGGTLTIRGTGDMYDWYDGWRDYTDTISEVIIENGVTSIGDYAFYDCENLYSITIPDSVERIGSSVLSSRGGPSEITIPAGVTSIASDAFGYSWVRYAINVSEDNQNYSSEDGVLFDKNKTTLILCPAGKFGEYTIPDGVTMIVSGAFCNCDDLVKITIPDSVTSIELEAFYLCNSLAEINVSENNTTYSSEDGVLFNKAKTRLILYPKNKRGEYVIPDSVESFEYDAFRGCYGLEAVTISNKMNSIEDLLFSDCESIKRVTIPDSVTSIGERAFQNCTGLTDVYYGGSKADWGNITIGYGNGKLVNAVKHYGKIAVTGVALDQSSITLIEEESYELGADVYPETATNKAVTWTTSNADVATVENGVVTAVAEGTATITVTTVDGEFTATCAVTVTKRITGGGSGGADAPKIKIGTAQGKGGDMVDITISLENNVGIISMLLDIDYDSNALTLTGVTDAGVLGDKFHSDDFAAKPYTLYWHNGTATENYTTNGVIATLTFKINDGAAEGEYPISVAYDSHNIFNYGLNSVNFDTESGGINVIRLICGDLNNDGKVNAKDDTALARYLARWIGYDKTTVCVDAADTNNDGKVNAKDNSILARHIAKWIGYETLPHLK